MRNSHLFFQCAAACVIKFYDTLILQGATIGDVFDIINSDTSAN